MQACTGSAHNRARLRAYIVYRAGGQRLACVGRGDRFFGVRGQPQRSPPLCRLALARSFALASPLRSVTRTLKPFRQACQRAGFPELPPRRFVTAPGIVRATAPGVPVAAGREFLHAFFALAQRNQFLHLLAGPSASCQCVPRAASSFRRSTPAAIRVWTSGRAVDLFRLVPAHPASVRHGIRMMQG